MDSEDVGHFEMPLVKEFDMNSVIRKVVNIALFYEQKAKRLQEAAKELIDLQNKDESDV